MIIAFPDRVRASTYLWVELLTDYEPPTLARGNRLLVRRGEFQTGDLHVCAPDKHSPCDKWFIARLWLTASTWVMKHQEQHSLRDLNSLHVIGRVEQIHVQSEDGWVEIEIESAPDESKSNER